MSHINSATTQQDESIHQILVSHEFCDSQNKTRSILILADNSSKMVKHIHTVKYTGQRLEHWATEAFSLLPIHAKISSMLFF